MHIRILFYCLVVCFYCSCGRKASESVDTVPVIRLDPDHAGTLTVSDYFDRVEVCFLKGALFFRIMDFVEYPHQYVVLAYDHPDLLIGKPRLYMFDKEGRFTSVMGQVGRGAGEYQAIFNGLQITKDSVIHIIDHNKYLALKLNEEVVAEKKINFASSHVGALPERLWNDSLVILYTSPDFAETATRMRKNVGKSVNTHLIDFYSLNADRIVRSYFPLEEIKGLSVRNDLYAYGDTLCFYHDKNQTIYRVFPDRVEESYRIDKGKYNRILTLEEDKKVQLDRIPTAVIRMSSCNETDKYVLGSYVFKGWVYYFIYDKQTRKTENFRQVNNDLLGLDGGKARSSILWRSGFSFKQDYLWLKTKSDWVGMIDQVKSQLNAEEWNAYCEEHSDFIRICEELRKDKEALEKTNLTASGDEEEKAVLLRYYFK